MSAPARNGSVGRSFDGRSVVVTGAAGGIGCAVAAGFARRGASVLIGDIDADRVSAAVERIGLGVRGQVLDVRSVDSFTSFLATAEDAQGPLDIVVNNPGVDWMGPFDTQPLSAMTREVEVNLVGIINGSLLALKRMLPRAGATSSTLPRRQGASPNRGARSTRRPSTAWSALPRPCGWSIGDAASTSPWSTPGRPAPRS